MEQNQSDSFQNEMNALTVEQCEALKVNDKIDHWYVSGCFCTNMTLACIIFDLH